MFVKRDVIDFNLDHIFDCGQCFRWEKENDGSYTGIAYGKVVNISFEKDVSDGEILDCEERMPHRGRITIENATEEDFENIWKRYLDLDRDYGEIKAYLSEQDNIVKNAITYGEGIRILNQEKWETLISFIISQNNNIPRIKKCIEGLAEKFGEEIGEFRGRKFYSMPTAEVLSKLTEEDLSPIKLGYRARYIIEVSKAITKDEGKSLAMTEEMSYDNAYKYLNSLCGVGPKVANCILLFSMRKMGSFPIDVWVKRAMKELYGFDENDVRGIKNFAEEKFGEYGGIAQQYLFYYMRWHESKK